MKKILRNTLKTIFKNDTYIYIFNTIWMLLDVFIRMLSSLFVGVWVARYLGPNDFGIMSFVISFISIFFGLSRLGLDTLVVRELVSTPHLRDKILGSAFWLRTISSVSVIFVIIILIKQIDIDYTTSLFIMVVASGFFFQNFDVIEFYFQSIVRAKVITICKIMVTALSAILKIICILAQLEIQFFIILLFIDSFLIGIIYATYYRVNIGSSFLRFINLNYAYDLIKEGLPLILAGLSFTIFTNIDAIMLNTMVGNEATGLYKAAHKITVVWHFLPGLLLTSVLPAMVKAETGTENFERIFNFLSSSLIWLSVFLAVIISIYNEEIIHIAFGKDFSESATVLLILAWINILIFHNSCWNYLNILQKRTRNIMYFHMFTAVSNILFNLILIPHYGAAGAAYAILLSLVLCMACFSIFDKRLQQIFVHAFTFGRL